MDEVAAFQPEPPQRKRPSADSKVFALRYERVLENMRDAHVQQIHAMEGDLTRKVARVRTQSIALLRKTTVKLEAAEQSPRVQKILPMLNEIRDLEDEADRLAHEEEVMLHEHQQDVARMGDLVEAAEMEAERLRPERDARRAAALADRAKLQKQVLRQRAGATALAAEMREILRSIERTELEIEQLAEELTELGFEEQRKKEQRRRKKALKKMAMLAATGEDAATAAVAGSDDGNSKDNDNEDQKEDGDEAAAVSDSSSVSSDSSSSDSSSSSSAPCLEAAIETRRERIYSVHSNASNGSNNSTTSSVEERRALIEQVTNLRIRPLPRSQVVTLLGAGERECRWFKAVLDRMKDQMRCGACGVFLREPHIIWACGHSYCATCLDIETEKTRADTAALKAQLQQDSGGAGGAGGGDGEGGGGGGEKMDTTAFFKYLTGLMGKMKEVFASMDEDGDGVVELEEFCSGVEKLRLGLGRPELEEIFCVAAGGPEEVLDYMHLEENPALHERREMETAALRIQTRWRIRKGTIGQHLKRRAGRLAERSGGGGGGGGGGSDDDDGHKKTAARREATTGKAGGKAGGTKNIKDIPCPPGHTPCLRCEAAFLGPVFPDQVAETLKARLLFLISSLNVDIETQFAATRAAVAPGEEEEEEEEKKKEKEEDHRNDLDDGGQGEGVGEGPG